MESKLLLIGGGGHALSVIDSLIHNEFDSIGIVEKNNFNDPNQLPFPVVGVDSDLLSLLNKGYTKAFITVGSVGDTCIRTRLYNQLLLFGFEFINIIDPKSSVSANVKMEHGVYIGNNAFVNSQSFIGKMVIINTSAIVEHQCEIEDFAHIASGAVLCAGVKVGAHSHIGAGSVIKQGITIGKNTTIGIGSVVTKNIESNVVAYGNPCQVIKKKDDYH